MRYYLTGSHGFIGQHLAARLRREAHEVIEIHQRGFFVSKDNEPFTVVHLQAYGNHYYQKDIDRIIEVNIGRLKYLLEATSTPFLVKFFNISTSSIELEHQTFYSLTKYMGEKMVENLYDNRFINVRPYSVFGEGEAQHRFIPTVIDAIKTGKEIELVEDTVHDWIHVEDFIEAVLIGETQIGTGTQRTNLEVVRVIERIMGKRLNYKKVDSLRQYDTVTKWHAAKGVKHLNFETRLRQTIQGYE